MNSKLRMTVGLLVFVLFSFNIAIGAEKKSPKGDGLSPKVGSAKAPARAIGRVVPKVHLAPVRSRPAREAGKRFLLKKGKAYAFTEEKGSWYRIVLKDGRSGWAYKGHFAEKKITSVTPAGDSVGPGKRPDRADTPTIGRVVPKVHLAPVRSKPASEAKTKFK